MTITTYSAFVDLLDVRPFAQAWAVDGAVDVDARMAEAVAFAIWRDPEAAVLRVRSSNGVQLVGLMPAGLAA